MRIHKIATVLVIFGALGIVYGQTVAAVKPVYIAGDVAAIGAKSVVIKTKAGQTEVMLTDNLHSNERQLRTSVWQLPRPGL